MSDTNLELVQGGTWTTVATWEIDSVPVDLTGYTVECLVGRRGTYVTTSATVTDAAGGEITVTIADDVTAEMDGKYDYSLRVTSGGGTTSVLAYGKIKVVGAV